MWDLIEGNEDIYIILYCLIVLVINISFLRDYKNIKKGLNEISSNDLEVDPASLSLLFIGLLFNFFRRWLIYIFAVLITESTFVVIISFVLFVISLYDSLFNYSLARVKKSNAGLYLAIADTVFISIFVIFLFVS
ncbi:hypothetical protein CEY16_11335 [Halalkalibacillus sediminis]|uniref:Uncharacterized protein n=1 Tax=Halalkalibacillus sediminis TaxID=2018042 RepID=A0A2I0QSM8_9BACI|nr:hypothetical protein [Halalkalibacillus sediminis]PKR77319.1 hypothetical protein CEY16_11335 [Halalkalibacillus sediminis]